MIFKAGRGWVSIVNLDEHESAVVGKPMGCDVGCRERNAAEGLDRVGVELWVGGCNVSSSPLVRDCRDCMTCLGDLHGRYCADESIVVCCDCGKRS